MKRIALATLLAIGSGSFAIGGDLYQHVQLPLVEAYVDSSVAVEPEIPGMGAARYFVCVSLTSQDAFASVFAIYVRVLLADGSMHVIKTVVPRENTGAANAPTVGHFFVGNVKPVKVVAFNVTRFHPEGTDQLIKQ